MGPASPQTQTNQTANRAAGTIYRNPSATLPLIVSTSWDLTGKNVSVSAYCDASSTPATLVAKIIDPSNSGGVAQQMIFFVPPSFYYQCAIAGASGGNPALLCWIEYQ